MAATIAAIEAAILARLEPLRSSLGVRTLEGYQGDLGPEELAQAAKRFPAIFVVYGGSQFDRQNKNQAEEQLWMLFVGDRSFRGQEARTGGATGPGTYALLEGVRGLLDAQQLLTGLLPLSLTRQYGVSFERNCSVYAAEYSTMQRRTI
jgi:phage gp37-like protein